MWKFSEIVENRQHTSFVNTGNIEEVHGQFGTTIRQLRTSITENAGQMSAIGNEQKYIEK